MSSPFRSSAPPDLAEQAAVWLARVESENATAADWAALTDWLEASPDHLAAYEAIEAAWRSVGSHRDEIAAGLIPYARRAGPPPGRGRIWMTITAVAASLIAAISAPLAWRAVMGVPQTFVTGPGEVRSVTLKDGSRIQMNGRSTLKARLGWMDRRIQMAGSEAAFDVAHDPGRPFLIEAGDQTVKVIGTAFNIRQDDLSVTVSVRRGVVEVSGVGPAIRLTAGEELRRFSTGAGLRRRLAEPAAAVAWTTGRLAYSDRRVDEVVTDLNRRYSVPIRATSEVGAKRFSGVLTLEDQATTVRRLAAFAGARARRTDDEFVLD